MELARISDHLICNSIVGVDSGAYSGFLYLMQYRELIYEIYEGLWFTPDNQYRKDWRL